MGSPRVEEITLAVEYNTGGKPTAVRYVDQEGCGHASDTFELSAPIVDVTTYHLRHCARSHEVYPRIMCDKKVEVQVNSAVESETMRCTLEKHDSRTQHVFML